ncbi:putative Cell division cycle protein 27 [Paratrimastix pyriformis]|uniref:Cell division cycle protein 27 n=1 Tax=Paratrimastix pyriformis TaxID=342808 RepID=A0ABQ8ULF0_9EUKA|nr:putative Cell division cycle protein 27 [Paratrimastix pyriformis]
MQRDEVTSQFLNKFERGIFNIFYLGRLESPLPRLKTAFFIIQTLQLFFQLVAIPAVFSLSLWVQIPIWVLDASLTRLTLGVLYALFGVAAFATLAAAVASVVLGLVVTKDTGAAQWPLRIVRGFYFLLSWILFVPAFGIFLDLLAKCLIVCAERVLTVHTVLRVVLIMASTGVVLVMLLWMLPYHTRLANMMFMGEYWVCFLAALEWSILNLALPQYADGWVPFVILVGASLSPDPSAISPQLPSPSPSCSHPRAAHMRSVPHERDTRYTATLALKRADVRRLLGAIQPGGAPNTSGPRILCPPPALPCPACCLPDPLLPQPFPRTLPSPHCQPHQDPICAFATLSGTAHRQPPPTAHRHSSARAAPTITPPAGEGTTPASAALEDGALLLGGDLPSADAVVARCRWSLSVEWATRFLRWKEAVGDARLQALAKAIYAKGTTKFPESHGLLLNYAEFLYTMQRNSASAMSLIRRVTALPGTAIDTRFSIYAAERRFESAGEGAQAAGLMNAITQRRLMRQAQSHHRRAKSLSPSPVPSPVPVPVPVPFLPHLVRLHHDFILLSHPSAALFHTPDRLARVWAFLMRPHLDVQSLPRSSTRPWHANTALEAYSSLIKSFPTNVPLLRAYGSLLQDLYGDTDLSDTLFIQADQLEEEKGGGTGGTDGESMAGHSVANTAKKGSLGRAPSVASRQTHSQKSLTLGEGGTGFDYRSVIAFLLRRHKGAATSDASSEDGPEDVAGGCTPLRATTWAVFLLTVVTVAFLAGCLVILYAAVDASNDMGAILMGNTNSSVMVQKMAYVSRKIFESMMQGGTLLPDGSYSVDNFTLSPVWKPKVQGWVAKLTVLANTMNAVILTTGAQGALREAWTTWEYPVVLPVVSGGVLTTINFATANLWSLAEDMIGKSRHVGLSGVAQLDTDPVQSELLYMMLNGPYILGPALANISWPETSPFYTGACALLFCLGGVLINCLSLRHVARERRGVMAFYTNLPRDVVRAEYTRLKKNKETEETDAPPLVEMSSGAPTRLTAGRPPAAAVASSSPDTPAVGRPQTLEEVDEDAPGDMVAPPSLVPPRGAGTASPARRSPVPGSAVTSSPVVPDDEGTEGGDVVAPSPVSMAVPATPLMAPGPLPLGPDLHKRMQVSLEDRQTSSDEDVDGGSPESRRRGHPSLRHPSATGAVGSIPENPLASLLAMTQASQQAASSSLLPQLSSRADQADEQEEEGRPTVASLAPVRKVPSGEAADSEKEDGGAEGEEKSEARLEADSQRKEAVRKLDTTVVTSKNLIIRLTVAVAFSTLFILGTGFVGYSQASSVTPFFGQVAAYGARVAQLAQTNVLVYQLVHNRTIAYVPFAGVDPAVESRVRYLLDVDDTYPLATTSRSLLREQIGSSLHNLTQLHSIISSVTMHAPLGRERSRYQPTLWASPEIQSMWFDVHECLLYTWSQWRCVPGRIVGWPNNGTLAELFNTYLQSVGRLTSVGDNDLVPSNLDFQSAPSAPPRPSLSLFPVLCLLTIAPRRPLRPAALDRRFIDTAFDWDLIEGLGRVTLLFYDSFKAVVASQLDQVVIFYTLCMIHARLPKIQDCDTYTQRLTHTLSCCEVSATSLNSVPPTNVKELDELHLAIAKALNVVRDGLTAMQPLSVREPHLPHLENIIRFPPSRPPHMARLFLCGLCLSVCFPVFLPCPTPDWLQQLAESYEASMAATTKSFEVEEHMMRQHAMPARKAHAADHAAQLKKYGDVLPALREERPEAVDMLTAILRERPLIAHCAKFDVAMGHFLNRPTRWIRDYLAAASVRHIFLTGATGFVGCAVLGALMKRAEGTKICCLVRAKTKLGGYERLKAAFTDMFGTRPDPLSPATLAPVLQTAFDERVVVFLGDLAEPQIGLAPEDFALLTGPLCDTIYHCAWVVHFKKSLKELESATLRPLEYLLGLTLPPGAGGGPPKRLVFLTSVSAVSLYPSQDAFLAHSTALARRGYAQAVDELIHVPETLNIPWEACPASLSYAVSKVIAESIIHRFCAAHPEADVRVYRLGGVSWYSTTGHWAEPSYLSLLVKGCLFAGGLFPDLPAAWVDWIPVDWVAKVTAPARARRRFALGGGGGCGGVVGHPGRERTSPGRLTPPSSLTSIQIVVTLSERPRSPAACSAPGALPSAARPAGDAGGGRDGAGPTPLPDPDGLPSLRVYNLVHPQPVRWGAFVDTLEAHAAADGFVAFRRIPFAHWSFCMSYLAGVYQGHPVLGDFFRSVSILTTIVYSYYTVGQVVCRMERAPKEMGPEMARWAPWDELLPPFWRETKACRHARYGGGGGGDPVLEALQLFKRATSASGAVSLPTTPFPAAYAPHFRSWIAAPPLAACVPSLAHPCTPNQAHSATDTPGPMAPASRMAGPQQPGKAPPSDPPRRHPGKVGRQTPPVAAHGLPAPPSHGGGRSPPGLHLPPIASRSGGPHRPPPSRNPPPRLAGISSPSAFLAPQGPLRGSQVAPTLVQPPRPVRLEPLARSVPGPITSASGTASQPSSAGGGATEPTNMAMIISTPSDAASSVSSLGPGPMPSSRPASTSEVGDPPEKILLPTPTPPTLHMTRGCGPLGHHVHTSTGALLFAMEPDWAGVARVAAAQNNYLYDNAVFLAEQLFASRPSEESLHLLSLSYFRASKFHQTYMLLKGRYGPTSRLLFARTCFQLGRHQEALDVLSDGQPFGSQFPPSVSSSPASLHLMGLVCGQLCLREQAEGCFRRAVALDPFLWASYEELCKMGVDIPPASLFTSEIPTPHPGPIAGCLTAMPAAYPAAEAQPSPALHPPSYSPAPFRAGSPPRRLMATPTPAPAFATPTTIPTTDSSCGSTPATGTFPRLVALSPLGGGLLPGPQADLGPGAPSALSLLSPLSPGNQAGPTPSPGAGTGARAACWTDTPTSGGEGSPLVMPALNLPTPVGAAGPARTPFSGGFAPAACSLTTPGGATPAGPSEQPRGMSLFTPAPGPRPPAFCPEGEDEAARVGDAPEGPTWRRLLCALGEGLRLLGRYRCADALAQLHRVPPAHLQTGWVLEHMGRAQAELMQYAQAAHTFSQCRQMAPHHLGGMETFSSVLYTLRRTADLALLAQQLAALDRWAPETLLALGNYLALLGDHPTAMSCFLKATQVAPSMPYAHTLAGHENTDQVGRAPLPGLVRDGVIYHHMQQLDLAERHLRRALAINPTSPGLVFRLALTLEGRRPAEALAVLEEAHRAAPGNLMIRAKQCALLTTLGRPLEAHRVATELLEVEPAEAHLHYLSGVALTLLGRHQEAFLALATAHDLSPRDDQIRQAFQAAIRAQRTQTARQPSSTAAAAIASAAPPATAPGAAGARSELSLLQMGTTAAGGRHPAAQAGPVPLGDVFGAGVLGALEEALESRVAGAAGAAGQMAATPEADPAATPMGPPTHRPPNHHQHGTSAATPEDPAATPTGGAGGWGAAARPLPAAAPAYGLQTPSPSPGAQSTAPPRGNLHSPHDALQTPTSPAEPPLSPLGGPTPSPPAPLRAPVRHAPPRRVLRGGARAAAGRGESPAGATLSPLFPALASGPAPRGGGGAASALETPEGLGGADGDGGAVGVSPAAASQDGGDDDGGQSFSISPHPAAGADLPPPGGRLRSCSPVPAVLLGPPSTTAWGADAGRPLGGPPATPEAVSGLAAQTPEDAECGDAEQEQGQDEGNADGWADDDDDIEMGLQSADPCTPARGGRYPAAATGAGGQQMSLPPVVTPLGPSRQDPKTPMGDAAMTPVVLTPSSGVAAVPVGDVTPPMAAGPAEDVAMTPASSALVMIDDEEEEGADLVEDVAMTMTPMSGVGQVVALTPTSSHQAACITPESEAMRDVAMTPMTGDTTPAAGPPPHPAACITPSDPSPSPDLEMPAIRTGGGATPGMDCSATPGPLATPALAAPGGFAQPATRPRPGMRRGLPSPPPPTPHSILRGGAAYSTATPTATPTTATPTTATPAQGRPAASSRARAATLLASPPPVPFSGARGTIWRTPASAAPGGRGQPAANSLDTPSR